MNIYKIINYMDKYHKLQEQLQVLQFKAQDPATASLIVIDHNTCHSDDARHTFFITEADLVKREMDKIYTEIENSQKLFSKILEKFTNAEAKQVLYFRYILCMCWKEIEKYTHLSESSLFRLNKIGIKMFNHIVSSLDNLEREK